MAPLETNVLEVDAHPMRLSTKVLLVGILLIVIPIPVLPPFVGAAIGLVLVALGAFLRFMDL
ncbi:hypothetical protein B1756_08745 [Natrarchaeobaculum aegyptiacum]|uniref:Transporter n=1 Tax=Natrarchaeobaculum aegyptiacum TaxID=745377 RepID=A0A2Z2HW85_9EURY|nr:hypothetical protein B1756_08745 [Natrarchaeobaculum aegyptiacum]